MDTELNGDDFGVYSLLRRFGPATPTQLHRWSGLRSTTISAHLKCLGTRGHAVRSPNPDDGRSHLVGLSEAGEHAHDGATERFTATMHVLRAKFLPNTLRERLVLQHIDTALRATAGLDERPYPDTQIRHGGHDQHHLRRELRPTLQSTGSTAMALNTTSPEHIEVHRGVAALGSGPPSVTF